jgi:cytochrome P450
MSDLTSVARSVEVPLLTTEVFNNPYPTYAFLREHDPVHWDDQLKGWVLTRYDDVYGGLRDHETFSSRRFHLLAARSGQNPSPPMQKFIRLASQWMWMLDPPEHTRVRKLMNQGFSPRDVRALEPLIQEIIADLVDTLLEKGEFDLMPDFSLPVPALVLCALYGLPQSDAPLIIQWCDMIKVFLGGAPDLAASDAPAAESLDHMMTYLTEVINDRRRAPSDDLISRLVQAEDSDGRLTDEELCSNLVQLLVATFETTLDFLGNGLLGLLTQRSQWELLKSDPSTIPGAVDEVLRYDGPVQLTHRLVTRDIELHGQQIDRGQLVYLVRGSANRDPSKFADPDRIDIRRSTAGHVALGTGIHYCIGAGLAKLEGALALSELTTRAPNLALVEDRPHRWRADNLQFRGLATLPATLDPA